MTQEPQHKLSGLELATYNFEGKELVIADLHSLFNKFEITYVDLVDVVIAAENDYSDESMNNLQNQLMQNMGVIDAYKELVQKHGYNETAAAFVAIVQTHVEEEADEDDMDEDPEGSIVASLEAYSESLAILARQAARGDISIAHVSQELASMRADLEALQTKVDGLV